MTAGVARGGKLERDPLDRGSGTAEYAEDRIFFGHDTADGGRREDTEPLEFAQVQQAEEGVDVGAGKVDLANRCGAVAVGKWF